MAAVRRTSQVDHITYDIANISILVVRLRSGTIKAFHNLCLHRGRLLKEKPGRANCGAPSMASPGTDGEVAVGLPPRHEGLVPAEVQVGRWGGFVFVI